MILIELVTLSLQLYFEDGEIICPLANIIFLGWTKSMMLTVVKLFQQEAKIRVHEIVLQILRGKYQIMRVAIRLKTLVCISSIIGHQYFMYLYFF